MSRGRPLKYIYVVVEGTWSKANRQLEDAQHIRYASTNERDAKAELYRRRKVWRQTHGQVANHIRLVTYPAQELLAEIDIELGRAFGGRAEVIL